MKVLTAGLVAALAASGAHSASSPPPTDINLTAFANGALVESSTSDYGGAWVGRWITDENPATGWASEKGAAGPFAIVVSLPERSEVHSLEFDTASTESAARAAKDVDVSISDTSASTGFALVATISLKSGADKQPFALAKAGSGRWIKLTVKTNHGDPDYSELMEFRAFGKQLSQTPLPTNLSGTYHSETYGDFHLQQDGAALTGCYEHKGGLVQGGAESHLMRLTWREVDGSGPAIMVLARDGQRFVGWWALKDSPGWRADWDLKKISEDVGSCPNWNPKDASGNIVATELAAQGRVRLYGINFDVDSDHLRADAKPTVDQVTAALKANPSWNVSIEGHTDSTGDAAHNLQLSQLRAESVKAALVSAGIAANRLTTTGLGQTKPVAPNDTEVGRAQNRRVEVVRR
jgi:outer membrane protein OmpA-like peptidoglycan-associated protein